MPDNPSAMTPRRSTAAHRHYPPALEAAERAAFNQRCAVNLDTADAPTVGIALSGGGIRSATFCLGLFQALARQRLVRKIDYLSTVSGGGYFGSFLGSAFLFLLLIGLIWLTKRPPRAAGGGAADAGGAH